MSMTTGERIHFEERTRAVEDKVYFLERLLGLEERLYRVSPLLPESVSKALAEEVQFIKSTILDRG